MPQTRKPKSSPIKVNTWISEQTALTYLSVFITKAERVYCAVWTGFLNQTDTVLSVKG